MINYGIVTENLGVGRRARGALLTYAGIAKYIPQPELWAFVIELLDGDWGHIFGDMLDTEPGDTAYGPWPKLLARSCAEMIR